jgi:hypothetical protein
MCSEGYYGDATQGTPFDCKRPNVQQYNDNSNFDHSYSYTTGRTQSVQLSATVQDEYEPDRECDPNGTSKIINGNNCRCKVTNK